MTTVPLLFVNEERTRLSRCILIGPDTWRVERLFRIKRGTPWSEEPEIAGMTGSVESLVRHFHYRWMYPTDDES